MSVNTINNYARYSRAIMGEVGIASGDRRILAARAVLVVVLTSLRRVLPLALQVGEVWATERWVGVELELWGGAALLAGCTCAASEHVVEGLDAACRLVATSGVSRLVGSGLRVCVFVYAALVTELIVSFLAERSKLA